MNTAKVVMLTWALFFPSFLAAARMEPAKPGAPAASDNAVEPACSAHYTEEGGFIGGKTFRTYQDFPQLNRETALEKIAQGLASDGWESVEVNKDVGLIIATQKLLRKGAGTQNPVNIVVKKGSPEGVRIELTFKGGGLLPKGRMKPLFCRILGFAEAGK
jgi:hypothetical protein